MDVDPCCEELFGDASTIGAIYLAYETDLSCCDNASNGLDVVEFFTYCCVCDTFLLDLRYYNMQDTTDGVVKKTV